MSSHTPAPWMAHETGGGLFGDVRDADGNIICDMYATGTTISEPRKVVETTNANARLIAKSPNMLQALKVSRQFVLEVAHAQESGPAWYTKGEGGMYQQVRMWLRRTNDAIEAALSGVEEP